MKIYFRCSETEKSISGKERFSNSSKKTILRKSWISLQNCVTEKESIAIVPHNVSDDTLSWLQSTAQCLTVVKNPVKEDATPHQGTEQLIDILLKEVNTNSDNRETHFLVEDDYLFLPNSCEIINKTMEVWGGFGIPNAPMSFFLNQDKYESKVLCGHDRHWIYSSILSFCIFGSTLAFKESANIWREAAKTTSLDVLKQLGGIMPLPGLSTHLKEGEMTPLIPFDDVWKSINL